MSIQKDVLFLTKSNHRRMCEECGETLPTHKHRLCKPCHSYRKAYYLIQEAARYLSAARHD